MSSRAVSWLSCGPLLLWGLPYFAKQVSPGHFGDAGLQWSFAVVNALLVPVVFLIGLKLLATDDRRKSGLSLIVCASLPLVGNLAMHGFGTAVMTRTQGLLVMPQPKEKAAMALLANEARTRENPSDRKKAAGLAYRLWGITAIWKNEAGELVAYPPDPKDEARWAQTQETDRALLATWQMMDGQLKQMPWLFALNLGSFVVITFSGLAWHAFRRPRVAPVS